MYIYTHLSDVINRHLTYFCLHKYGVNNLLLNSNHVNGSALQVTSSPTFTVLPVYSVGQ